MEASTGETERGPAPLRGQSTLGEQGAQRRSPALPARAQPLPGRVCAQALLIPGKLGPPL